MLAPVDQASLNGSDRSATLLARCSSIVGDVPCPWRVERIDIRSPVGATSWPVARLELRHIDRGRVTDIAAAPTTLAALFAAAGHILGIAPTLRSLNTRSTGDRGAAALDFIAELELEHGAIVVAGTSRGTSPIECSLQAWLNAAALLI